MEAGPTWFTFVFRRAGAGRVVGRQFLFVGVLGYAVRQVRVQGSGQQWLRFSECRADLSSVWTKKANLCACLAYLAFR